MLAAASLIARVLAAPGAPAPNLQDTEILLIQRSQVVLDGTCSPGDAGISDGGLADAGPVDAGVADALDAGDAGPIDAGAGCTPTPVDAVTLVVKPQVMVTGGTRFAVLFVTPSRPILETLADPFPELDLETAPVTTVETVEIQDPALGKHCTYAGCNAPAENQGCGAGGSPSGWAPPPVGDASIGDGAVVIEPVGPYEIVRAEPADPAELAAWLDQLGYGYAQADIDAIAPYIARHYTVVAVRVAATQTTGATLPPIALTYPGTALSLPAALGTESETNVRVYIAAAGRYELPNANVTFAGRTSLTPSGFVTRNELTLAPSSSPDDDPIATRIIGDPTFVTELVEHDEVHVPVEDCSEQETDAGCCGDCSTQRRRPRVDLALIAAAVALVILRRRR